MLAAPEGKTKAALPVEWVSTESAIDYPADAVKVHFPFPIGNGG